MIRRADTLVQPLAEALLPRRRHVAAGLALAGSILLATAAGLAWMRFNAGPTLTGTRAGPGMDVLPAVGSGSQASEAYVKGLLIPAAASAADWRTKVEYLELAITRDRGFARAHAELSRAYLVGAMHGFAPIDEALSMARLAALEALRLDASVADSHVALGDVRLGEWDWAGADAAYRKALELEPGNEGAIKSRAKLLTYARRFDEAIELRRRLVERDPVDASRALGLAATYIHARRFDAALDVLRSLAARGGPARRGLQTSLAVAYAGRGDCHNALDAADRAMRLPDGADDDVTLVASGWIYARCGRRADARSLLARYESPGRRVAPEPISLAALYGALGQTDRGIQLIERAIGERSPVAVVIDVDFMLDPLRRDPRFEPLAARVRGSRRDSPDAAR